MFGKEKNKRTFFSVFLHILSLTLFRYGMQHYESKLHTEVEISINISNCHVCDIQSHLQLIFFQFFFPSFPSKRIAYVCDEFWFDAIKVPNAITVNIIINIGLIYGGWCSSSTSISIRSLRCSYTWFFRFNVCCCVFLGQHH